VIKILYIHELDKKIQTLRQRTWRNPAPKRPRNGKAKTLVETLALKIEVELSHVPVEKNLVEEQNIKVYEKRTRIKETKMLEKEEVKHKAKKSEKGLQSMEIGDEGRKPDPRVYYRKPHTHPTNKLRLSFK